MKSDGLSRIVQDLSLVKNGQRGGWGGVGGERVCGIRVAKWNCGWMDYDAHSLGKELMSENLVRKNIPPTGHDIPVTRP